MSANKQLVPVSISVIAIVISVFTLMQLNASPDVSSTDMNSNHAAMTTGTAVPSMPGQEAFGTIQEIMEVLDSDPNTDWSQVDMETLRQHLIDMDELTMNAQLETREVPGGIVVEATGATPRTVLAIQRMVETHNRMTLQTIKDWNTNVTNIDNGVSLHVTSNKPQQTEKIRGLGFIGIMATGANHPPHHLMMAKGAMIEQ